MNTKNLISILLLCTIFQDINCAFPFAAPAAADEFVSGKTEPPVSNDPFDNIPKFADYEEEKCPYVTTKCNFKGKRTEICDSENKINSNIKSVYVPQGKTLTIWAGHNFQGETAIFSESNDCIDEIEFNNLVQITKHTEF